MMNKRAVILLAFCLSGSMASSSLIPRPVKMEESAGSFWLNEQTAIVYSEEAVKPEAQTLAAMLRPASGLPLPVQAQPADGKLTNTICLSLDTKREATLGSEGYAVEVKSGQVCIVAAGAAGLFYGGQTLRQLLPSGVFASTTQPIARWEIPCCVIEDRPRFAWRGFMLDSSRHFQTVDEIKRWIDLLALHKLNVLHWHLTDGHGWRIEIRKYPKLISVGAFREQPPVGRYGGYYTQKDIRDIVAYAAARHVMVVPEIEMPGHSKAAVASYPELLACDPNQPAQVDRFFDFPCPAQRFPSVPGSDVLCAGKESTYQFLADVLDEVMELFPSTYIHVGGDEVNPHWWSQCSDCKNKLRELKVSGWPKLQAYLMQRIEKHLQAHGRKLIGWDEIIEGGLSDTAAVTSWRGVEGGIHAARTGHDAVMSPGHPLYLDHGQTDHPSQPAHWPGKETLQQVYEYEPIPKELSAEQGRHILGLQGNLWSCFTHTEELLEIQGFPRLCAIAEVGWSSRERPAFADFNKRLSEHYGRLDAMGVNYWREPKTIPLGNWSPNPALKNGTSFDVPVEQPLSAGKWTVVFRYQKGADALMVDAVELLADGKVVASDVHEGTAGAQHINNRYVLLVPDSKTDTKWVARVKAHVQPWKQGGNGDTAGVMTLSEGTKVRTCAPELPLPAIRATIPDTQNRDHAIYDWPTRHQQVLDCLKKAKPQLVMIGDSITHYWAGQPAAPIVRSTEAWNRAFGNRTAANLGFGWDRTENVLWRIEHGELDGINPEHVVLLIGTNNLGMDTPEEVFAGIDAVCRAVHVKLPSARILVLGILPRKDQMQLKADLDKVNYLLQTRLHPRGYVRVYDIGNRFRNADGTFNDKLFSDGLHPNAAGYDILAAVLAERMDKK